MALAALIFLETGVRPSVTLVEAPRWERALMLEAMRLKVKARTKSAGKAHK